MSSRQPPDPNDPVEYYVEHLKKTGKAKSTQEWAKRSMKRFDEFLGEVEKSDYSKIHDGDCIDFIDWLRDGRTDKTVTNIAAGVNGFYNYYSTRGTYEINPMTLAMDQVDLEDDTSPHRREIPIPQMREAIQEIDRPRILVIIVLLLKTGMRVGELSNLDLRDINLTHPRAKNHLPEPREILKDRPNSIFVSSEIAEGDTVNDEKRSDSNKRKRDTIIPIDEEVQRVLVYYLATRVPARSEARPLLTLDTHPGRGESRLGDRLKGNMIYQSVTRWSKSNEWYTKGGGISNNVTPHYFRHYFTTHMRDRTNDDVFVKFIRGDKGDDIIDDYTHNWDNKVRSAYLNNIYNFDL